MEFEQGSITSWVNFTLEYDNRSDRDIRAFTGHMHFKDLFGRTIKRIALTSDDTVPADQVHVDTGKRFEISQFNEYDLKLSTTDFDDLTMSFEIDSIVFTDGTKLGSVE